MKKFKGIQEIRTPLGVFDISVITIVCPDLKEAERYIRWKFEDEHVELDPDGHGARGRFISRPGYVLVIWIPRKPRTPREHATLAHEALHATRYALTNWAGIEMSDTSEEVFTHTMAHIINNTLTQTK